MLDHLPRRDIALAIVAGMRRTLIRKVKRVVQFLGRECGIGRCDNHIPITHLLNECQRRLLLVTQLLLNDKVLGKGTLVALALLEGVENLGGGGVKTLGILLVGKESHLIYLAQKFGIVAVSHGACHLLHYPLTHAIYQKVGTTLHQNRRLQSVVPVVVVCKATQRGLDTSHNNGNMGVEALENLGIYRYGIVGTEAGLATSRVGVVTAQADVGRIVVYHRVHSSARHTKEQTWRAQLLEVAQIVPPVGLWHNGHTVALGFEQTTDDGGTK